MYGTAIASNTKIKCVFGDMMHNDGIFHHKKHLIGGYKDVVCPKVSNFVSEESRSTLREKRV